MVGATLQAAFIEYGEASGGSALSIIVTSVLQIAPDHIRRELCFE
jgi:hypothetical protein